MIDYTKYGTFEDFKAFVKAQPADREIDNSGGWSDCAVGDYLKTTTFFSDDNWFMCDNWFDQICPTEELYETFNNSDTCPNTYGKMAELLDIY